MQEDEEIVGRRCRTNVGDPTMEPIWISEARRRRPPEASRSTCWSSSCLALGSSRSSSCRSSCSASNKGGALGALGLTCNETMHRKNGRGKQKQKPASGAPSNLQSNLRRCDAAAVELAFVVMAVEEKPTVLAKLLENTDLELEPPPSISSLSKLKETKPTISQCRQNLGLVNES